MTQEDDGADVGLTAYDDDAPRRDGSDRYAIYVLRGKERHRIAETSEDSVVGTLRTLMDEEQIVHGDKIGLFDREERRWLINPWL